MSLFCGLTIFYKMHSFHLEKLNKFINDSTEKYTNMLGYNYFFTAVEIWSKRVKNILGALVTYPST